MINVQEYLASTESDGGYALVGHSDTIEPVYFFNYGTLNNADWFLESPCLVRDICDVGKDVDAFLKEYVEEIYCLEDDIDSTDFINEFLKPMVVNNRLYEIDCPQTGPFLPKEVDSIKILSEREMLDYLLMIRK